MASGWWVYLAMPVFMAGIGYATKVVAVRMMFTPLTRRGWGPFSWQGVVPRRAARMAAIATELLTSRLISPREVVRRLDPEAMAEHLRVPLESVIEQITREVMEEHSPGVWAALPEGGRVAVVRRVQAELPQISAAVLRDVRDDVDRVLDLKTMVTSNLIRDRALLNRIFLGAGAGEFRFIIRSGIYFGFLIGCVQATVWYFTHNPWILPVFGAINGWLTDWLALKMIFHPKRPVGIGRLRWQGLFLARREEVTQDYATLVAHEVLTPRQIFEALLHGPLSDRVFAMTQRHVQRAVDGQTGVARPLVVLAAGSRRYRTLKREITDKVMARLPETLASVEAYTEHALDIRTTLVHKMRELSDEEFEELIRPAFRADEWILITVGAVLGFGLGELQVLALEQLG
uniref:Uncharacterized protein n=1 Tax=uncultured Nocardioidaceae bacterium TaxID=253824 RepID=A0A6J4L526_9ACTN|nr:MAG: hypothetical protein AVDCRST_MAG46-1025 [uncultured Nocardioidaceae bacterium]